MQEGIRLTGTMLKNFAGYPAISVEYPDGVNYICGPNGSGKSTLTIVQLQACIAGISESKSGNKLIGDRFTFIGSLAKSSDVVNRFHDSRNGRNFSIKNHITESGNKITVQPEDDKPVPPEWMCEFLSVNLMSEKHFCSLSAKEQALALGIDTKPFDERIAELKVEYRAINKVISGYGDIQPVEKIDRVDIDALKVEKQKIADRLNGEYTANRMKNATARAEWEAERRKHESSIEIIKEQNEIRRGNFDRCKAALGILVEVGYTGAEVSAFIESLPLPAAVTPFSVPEPEYINEMPDRAPLDAIDSEIERAHQTNAKADKYDEYLKRTSERDKAVASLKTNEEKQEEEKKARLEYIRQFDFGFVGLDTNEAGELQLNGRQIREPYFSTGERIRIVAKLMRSRSPLFKTVFLDSFCELDDVAGPKLLEELVADGFHPIVSIPRSQPVEGQNCIILRECRIVGDESGERLL